MSVYSNVCSTVKILWNIPCMLQLDTFYVLLGGCLSWYCRYILANVFSNHILIPTFGNEYIVERKT